VDAGPSTDERGASADGGCPGSCLFQIDLQDELLPSLDDGVSWTALMDNYRMTGIDAAQIAHLDKREKLRPHSDLRTLLSGTYKTGESVTVPVADGPVIAVVGLEPTLFGKLVETVFKPTQVRLLLTLADGSRRDYRVLPNLMKTGMVLSPLVEDTDGFAKLISGDRGSLGHAVVKTMTLEPYRPTWRIWADQYTLKLEEYRGGAWSGEDAEKKLSEMKVP
jgi:hypothetical protein